MKNNCFTAATGAENAFTLAEVLVTLAIIGVVAAMTVPALMTSTRGKEFEVGANKALSTIANALTMRYAMDGQTLADYAGSAEAGKIAVKYLTELPRNSRPGEQAALQVVERSSGGESVKLKDGSIIAMTQGCNAGNHYIVIDTNGEKGPTRSKIADCGDGRGAIPCYESSTAFSWTCASSKASVNDAITTNNSNPDLVVFAINPTTGAVTPSGQRTRNILATGNAMISE